MIASAVVGECDFLNLQERAAIVVALVADAGTGLGQSVRVMYLRTQQLINESTPDEPDPAATNALQEGLGGQFDEMRTSHVEFIGTPSRGFWTGAWFGKKTDPVTSRARSGDTAENHVRYQQHSSLPGRRSGRPPGRRCRQPWSRSYVQQRQPRALRALEGRGW